jgi:C4-dicarboxylate transporter DctM subunit
MFILMGAFATAAGMSRELFRASERLARSSDAAVSRCRQSRRVPGFAAINGSSVATAATMTQVALPEMRKAGYQPGLATGVIAAGGTLGIMIPPSVIFALYGVLTETDISKLLIAGVIPGLLGALMYLSIAVQIVGFFRPELMPRGPRSLPWSERFASLKDIWATCFCSCS